MEKDPNTPTPDSTPANTEPSSPTEISKDARSMALLSHLLGVLTSVLVPLIIWILKKEEDPYIEDQSKEALNFQITVIIAYFAVGIISVITFGIGAFLLPLVMIGNLAFGIIAAMKSNEGIAYRYPLSIRIIK
ncbi:MAG: putative Tic20 family protein [Candidatus Pelagisphaera sp.]|jgi:uncharacterized Tic20 family protein